MKDNKSKSKYSVVNYPVGDFLIKVKNTAMAGNKKLSVSTNNQITAVAESMKKSGFFESVVKDGKDLTISLSFKDKTPLLMDIKLISKPGRRIYMGADEIGARRGPSEFLISTPKGIMSTREALKARSGGEVIAEIF
ncbi:MAG TPA: 30S ribosomal protein S8 [Patescibacteria group bacterium]|nr:30S ribosomal protein S8 [Patescibacteria group bacterium]